MKVSRSMLVVLCAIALLAMVLLTGAIPPPIIFVAALALGWIFYLVRVIPQVTWSGSGIAIAVVCIIGIAVIGHALAAWFWKSMQADLPTQSKWKMRWTFASMLLVILLFGCGIAAVGITHQSIWLAKSDEPMFSYRSSLHLANRVRCASNLRQIGQAIQLYCNDHGGAFPNSFEDLTDYEITPEVFVCPATDVAIPSNATTQQFREALHGGLSSYVYHGRGLHAPVPATQPIACEPLANHGDGVNVLFGDYHAEWLTPQQAERVMSAVR